jgi:hypothetical protein
LQQNSKCLRSIRVSCVGVTDFEDAYLENSEEDRKKLQHHVFPCGHPP